MPIYREILELGLEDDLENVVVALNLVDGILTRPEGSIVRLGTHQDLEYGMEKAYDLRPIFFRRTSRFLGANMQEVAEPIFVYAIGFQCRVLVPVVKPGELHWHEEEKTVKHIIYVHEDGKVILT